MKAITIWSVILFGVSCTLLYACSGLFTKEDASSVDKTNTYSIDEKGVVNYESQLFSTNTAGTMGKSSAHISQADKK